MTRQKKQVRISDIIIPKYMPIFNDTRHRHIILTSGRAGTKSSMAAIRADYQIISDQNGSVVVIRKHHNKLRKTVYKEMLRGINRLQVPKKNFIITKSPMEITYKKYGTTIYFSGSDGIDDTKGIIDEDKPIKLVVLDELTEFFDDGDGEDELANIEATFIRGNTGGFQMIYLFNPPKNPNAPVNVWCKKMERRPDCIHIHTDYRDVPESWLGPDLIASAKLMEQMDPKMYRWTWLGEAIGVDELIYYMFSEKSKMLPEPERLYQTVIIGGDYGQQNATTYQAFALDDYRHMIQGLCEFYHSGRASGKQHTPSEYAEECMELMMDIYEKYETQVFYVYLDPSAKGLQEEIKQKTRDLPFSVYVRDAENDVALGISRVQKALAYHLMTISPLQKQAVDEFGTYEYDKKSIERGKEVPVKVNDHCMDAIRYAVMGAWKWIKRWLPEDIEKDEKLETVLDREDEDEYI